MFSWLLDNLATIIICIVLLAVVALIVRSMIVNKKKGKSSCSCGCGCDGCPSAGMCHPKGDTTK
ncbi:MAG: FeoB-associated Cys-rich membrane protein [Ruminococcus sp.]|nr:FeoB-associated Cys-rich membrane protein [Ruminococcus sp.]MCD7727522.1 FeoB-associated Cys-rich membrane protein [Ruminococcus sp.]MCD7772550.1 FeoB-associated Cys-rich membrane protein [Ruminococcus sp.]MCD8327843.1 FeoB-associated Cys-rich membrane protein [Ruminococcus sp.]